VAGPCGAQQAKHKASLHISSLLREADREAVSFFDLVHLQRCLECQFLVSTG